MEKTRKRKAIMLSLCLAAMLLAPRMASAQFSGDYNLIGDDASESYLGDASAFNAISVDFESLFDDIVGLMKSSGGNRDGGISFSVNTQDFEGPLGSGIAVLLGLGLGYAALKRKEDKQ